MGEELILCDDFMDDRSAGRVIGTLTASGHKRLGVDVEKILGIDNGALRIAPLFEAGFGRAVLSYGPFPRRDGLAFSVRILNGHNTAQAGSLPDTFRDRIGLWFRGSHADPRWRRLVRWIASGRVRRTVRQFRWWKRTAKDSRPVPLLDENLAVGWFPTKSVPDPRQAGSAFIMHALGPENGELWTGGNGTRTRSLRGVQNLPLYLVTVLRPEGMLYFVSSMDGAPGMVPHPFLRPVALEYGPSAEELYLGIQQSVLGQIGWRLDTRIQGVRVAPLGGYASWCGGAIAADRFEEDRDMDGSQAEVGGAWRVIGGTDQRGVGRETVSSDGTMAILDPPITLRHGSRVGVAGKRRTRTGSGWSGVFSTSGTIGGWKLAGENVKSFWSRKENAGSLHQQASLAPGRTGASSAGARRWKTHDGVRRWRAGDRKLDRGHAVRGGDRGRDPSCRIRLWRLEVHLPIRSAPQEHRHAGNSRHGFAVDEERRPHRGGR